MASINDGNALTQVVASRRQSIDFYAVGMALPNPDTVLKALGQDIKVYRELKADASLGGLVRRRKSAARSLENGFRGECDPQVMKFLQDMFKAMPMRRIISELLDAPQFGYQPAELMWIPKNGKWHIADIVGKPQEWFAYNDDNELLLRTRENWLGAPVPDNKFVVARQEPTYQNPYGFPDLSMCFWPVAFKKGGLRFWVQFAEKYGTPWLIAKHPRGTIQTEIDVILDSLEALSQNSVGSFPNDSSVEILEAAGKSASADLYEKLLMFCRSEMSIAQTGQNQTTEANSNKASALVGQEVTHDIRDGDAAIVAEALTQAARWAVDKNFGTDVVCPSYEFWEQDEVNDKQATRDEKLTKSGARFTEQYFIRSYNLQKGDLLPPAEVAKMPISFSEQLLQSPDYASLTTAKLQKNAAPEMLGWLKRIKSVVDNATSLESLQADLVAEFSELPIDKLTQVMSIAFTAADLTGRAEVVNGG